MAVVYRNGRPYLYQSIRRGGRVTSEYVASGEVAVLAGALAAIDREERDRKRQQEQQEQKQAADLEQALDELAERAYALAREALNAAGYYQHHRGEWRKRRGNRTAQA